MCLPPFCLNPGFFWMIYLRKNGRDIDMFYPVKFH